MLDKEIIDEWYEKAKHIKNPDELKEFIEYVYSFGDFPGYDEGVHAITAIAIASSWCANEYYNITGFQASCVGLQYLMHWTYDYSNLVGISVRNWSDMLYPQCQHRFEKKISKDMFKALQEKAQEKLDNEGGCEAVLAHWQSIVDGVIPFGYELTDDIF